MAKAQLLGKVDLLGLNQYGHNPGLSPIWGALIGGGTAGVTSIVVSHTSPTSWAGQNRELTGLLAGLAVSGGLYAMKSTRHAAIGSAIGAFIGAGLAWLERMLLGTATVPAAAVTPAPTGTKGIGYPNIRALNGLGIPTVRALNGLGIPAVSNTVRPVGTIPGVAGTQLGGNPPVSLLGTPTMQMTQLRGMGGPAVHGLSAAYGATLLGGGR